jgi:CBS domain-containing protein
MGNLQENLKRLLDLYGMQILDDPRRFNSLMLDYCGSYCSSDIKILTNTLREKIPHKLQYSANKCLTLELITSLAHHLEREIGMGSERSNWAIETWATAIGMAIVVERPQIEVDCKQIDFGEVATGTFPSKTFVIGNLGQSKLIGEAQGSEPWITVTPQNINVENAGEVITVTINSSLMPKKLATGQVIINTNGGITSVGVTAVQQSPPPKQTPVNTGIHKISEIMSTNPFYVHPGRTLLEANNMLMANKINSLAVVEKDRIIGIITRYDLRKYSFSAQSQIKVRSAMSTNPIILSRDTAIETAKNIMATRRFWSLLVGEQGKLIGIVTVSDIRRFESANLHHQ